MRKVTAVLPGILLILSALSGCRVVSTYRPSPPILPTPSETNRGELSAVLPDWTGLPLAYFYGPVSQGLDGWWRPRKGLILAGELFYWRDVTKFNYSQYAFARPSADHLPGLSYSGLSKGLEGNLAIGAYRKTSERITWALLGGYGHEDSRVRHLASLRRPDTLVVWKEARRHMWAKPFVQAYAYYRLLPEEDDKRLYIMAGYRAGLVMEARRRWNYREIPANLDDFRQYEVLRFLFGRPQKATLFHQPFIAFKAEAKRVTGSLRLNGNFSHNRQYLKHGHYTLQSVISWKF